MDAPDLQQAAQWLAQNGPGSKALREVRSGFQLRPKDTALVCAMASEIRREAFQSKMADHAKAGAS